jgi:hypothetical protein
MTVAASARFKLEAAVAIGAINKPVCADGEENARMTELAFATIASDATCVDFNDFRGRAVQGFACHGCRITRLIRLD